MMNKSPENHDGENPRTQAAAILNYIDGILAEKQKCFCKMPRLIADELDKILGFNLTTRDGLHHKDQQSWSHFIPASFEQGSITEQVNALIDGRQKIDPMSRLKFLQRGEWQEATKNCRQEIELAVLSDLKEALDWRVRRTGSLLFAVGTLLLPRGDLKCLLTEIVKSNFKDCSNLARYRKHPEWEALCAELGMNLNEKTA